MMTAIVYILIAIIFALIFCLFIQAWRYHKMVEDRFQHHWRYIQEVDNELGCTSNHLSKQMILLHQRNAGLVNSINTISERLGL